ncbi:MAG TPA: hypothetical protein VFO21_16655 [Vicinamibacterales bacterium]|nr:hypothetical protein [Vicinamibacterales bacterium]
MRYTVAILLIAAAIPAPARAQVDAALAGTWTLGGEAGRGGRGAVPGVPVATRLVIKVAPGQVTVDSNTGSAESIQTAVYKLDGSETTVPGPLGWTVKAKAAWKDSALVVSTIRSLEGPNGPIGAEIVDVYTVTGDALTIERTQGRNKQKLSYKRQS